MKRGGLGETHVPRRSDSEHEKYKKSGDTQKNTKKTGGKEKYVPRRSDSEKEKH